ncbi:MAG: hypothetical protein QNK23_10115 [Crocinitomicaceae bacterium]|nr:hypothetical protein [Crocinitomicaceae bacterium]
MTTHQKRMLLAAIVLATAAVSMFLPFEIREEHFYRPIFGIGQAHYERIVLSGFDIVSPLFSLGIVSGIFLLLAFGKNHASRVIMLVMSISNCLLLILILGLIHKLLDLFSNDMPISTGLGYYVLSLTALSMMVLSIVHIMRPYEGRTTKESTTQKHDADVIDRL